METWDGSWVRARRLRIKLIVQVIDWTWAWGRAGRCQECSLDFFLAMWQEQVCETDYYVGVTTPLHLGHPGMTLSSVCPCFISNAVSTEIQLKKYDAVQMLSKVTGKRSNPVLQVQCARQSWVPEFQWSRTLDHILTYWGNNKVRRWWWIIVTLLFLFYKYFENTAKLWWVNTGWRWYPKEEFSWERWFKSRPIIT